MKSKLYSNTKLNFFLEWWGQTLLSLVPTKLKTFLVNYTDKPLLIRFTNFQVYFHTVQQGIEIELGRFYLHKEGLKQRDAFFEENSHWQYSEKFLLLNEKQVLRKTLILPLAAQKNFELVVMYELNRYTPFKPDDLYFATKIIRKHNENKQIEVCFTFISKDRLHSYYKDLKEWGLDIDAMFYNADEQTESCNLLPKELRPVRTKMAQKVNYIFTVCFFVLLLTSSVMPLRLQDETITHLKQEITIAKRKANEVDAIKTEIDGKLQVLNKIKMLRQNSPPVLNILKQLTELLPQKTYLKSFEYTGNKVQILGLSSSASTLIGVLETSPYFKETNFVSPITQDTEAGGIDQFQLVTQIKKRTPN